MPRLLAPNPLQGHPYGSVAGPLKDGAALTNGVPASQKIVCAGLARFRVRVKATCAGTLSVRFCRADAANTPYLTNQPAAVPMAANTEAVLNVDPHFGEGIAIVTVTPSADGVLTYCDLSGV